MKHKEEPQITERINCKDRQAGRVRMFWRNRQPNQKQRGQSFVEFSLSLVLILLILCGLLDLGRVYLIYVALTDGAGEAALYLSINPNCPEPDPAKPECNDPNNARYRAV